MTTIKLKNGSGAPAGGDLVQGEPALDLTNKRLYTENGSGTVIEVGTNPTSITTGDITATGTATFANLATSGDVTFGDNDKAIFGAGSDLQIYHDGSGSYIDDAGTGNLFVRADSLQLRRADGSQLYLAANTGAEVALYHAGNAKLATTATGIDVTGKATADSFEVDATDDIRLRFLNASTFKGGLQIATTAGDMISGSAVDDLCIRGQSNILFATGGNTNRINIGSGGDISFYEDTGTTAKLFWDASAESLGIGTSSPTTALTVSTDGTEQLTINRADSSINSGNTVGTILFTGDDPSANQTGAKIQVLAGANWASNDYASHITFSNDSSGTLTERMRLDASGNVNIGTTAAASGSHKVVIETASTTGTVNSHIALIGDSATNGQGPQILFSESGDGQAYAGGTIGFVRTGSNSIGDLVFGTRSSAGDETTTTTEAMRIDSAGRVGINTSPVAKFDVVMGTGNRLLFTTTGSDTFVSSVNEANNAYSNLFINGAVTKLGTGGTERMRIDSSGNLLVGKTYTAASIAGQELRAGGYTAFTRSGGNPLELNRLTSDGTIVNFSKDGTSVGSIGTDLSRLFIGSDDSMIFFDAGSTNAIWPWKSTATSDGDADNTIDIGDSNNRFKNLYLSGQTLGATGTAGAPAYAFGNDTDMGMYRASNNNLAFSTNGGERMRIDGSGTSFFGLVSETDTPTNGGVYINGDRSVGATNSYPQIFVVHNSSVNHGIILKELGSTGVAMQTLNSSGTIVGSITTTNSATAYNTSSDHRLKENVVAMTGATARLKQLAPKRFNFIADSDNTVDGFLAHEVQSVVPEAITGTHNEVDDDGNAVYQGIDQSKLVPLLVATIQELEARIAALESN